MTTCSSFGEGMVVGIQKPKTGDGKEVPFEVMVKAYRQVPRPVLKERDCLRERDIQWKRDFWDKAEELMALGGE